MNLGAGIVKFSWAGLVLFLLIAVSFNVLAADTNTVVVSDSPAVIHARQQIAQAKITISDLNAVNISTQRVMDLLLIAQNSFDEALNRSPSSPDLAAFNLRMSEFQKVASLALSSHDELIALKVRMDKAEKDIPDMSEVNKIYDAAWAEFNDERYERVLDLIDSADQKIIELSSLQTRAQVAYDAAAANVRSFFSSYWKELAAGIVVFVVVVIIFRNRIKRMRLRQKIKSLEIEQQVLREEIKKSQKDYFVSGKMPEGVFNTRVNVFAEMLRDITREIALLREEEAKIIRSKSLDRVIKQKAIEFSEEKESTVIAPVNEVAKVKKKAKGKKGK